MSEEAYSMELGKKISAIEAHRKSLSGELTNAKAFRCWDENCCIDLTCSNWGKWRNKRIYFTPAKRDCLHAFNCNAVSHNDEQYRVNIETLQGKKTVIKNGIIEMKKNLTKSISKKDTDEGGDSVGGTAISRRTVSIGGKQFESRNISSIKTYINFYNDDDIDNNVCKIRIDGKILTLNQLFVNIRENKLTGVNRIFYGSGLVTTNKKNDEIVELRFVNTNNPAVFSNKKMLEKRLGKKKLEQFLDKGIECKLYFRGSIEENGKFKCFNDKYYLDIWIDEKE